METESITEFDRYRVGETVLSTIHDREVNHMLFLVAYDICDPRRLRLVAKICEDYGIRVEKAFSNAIFRPRFFLDFWTNCLPLSIPMRMQWWRIEFALPVLTKW